MSSADAAPMPSVLLLEEGGVGGVADYTDELAAALARSGWRVHLATGCDHPLPGPPGVHVQRLFVYVRGGAASGRLLRTLHLSKVVNGIAHLVAAFLIRPLARRCDVIHVQGEEWPPLGAVLTAILGSTARPVVYTPHNTFARGRRQYELSRRLIRRLAARVIVHSEHDRNALPASEGGKVSVIPHGTYGALARRGRSDIGPEDARRQLGIGDDEPLVLLFGQLRPDKGVEDLLLALQQTSGVRAILAGEDCGGLEKANGLLEQPQLRERVVLQAEFVPPAQAGRLFAACDAVVLPYRRASASGVLMLAYGYGRPAIVYPVGGLPEYVLDGQTGWICERPDPASLSRVLAEVASSGRAECHRRGEGAARFASETYGWDRIAESTISLYEEVTVPGSVRRSGRGQRYRGR